MVGRWQHFVRADPAQKANPVLPRRVTVTSNGSNYVTLCILFFADIIVQYTVMKRIYFSGAQKRAVASEKKRKEDNTYIKDAQTDDFFFLPEQQVPVHNQIVSLSWQTIQNSHNLFLDLHHWKLMQI